jgi:hypothetical protein
MSSVISFRLDTQNAGVKQLGNTIRTLRDVKD